MYGFMTLEAMPHRPTPKLERKPLEACVTLGSKCRMARAAAAEGSGGRGGGRAAATAAAPGRDTTRHLLTEGRFLGDLEDKRRVHGGSEIIGMWRTLGGSWRPRRRRRRSRPAHSPSSPLSSPPTL